MFICYVPKLTSSATPVSNRVMLLDLLKHLSVSLPLALKACQGGTESASEKRRYRTKL